MIGMVTKQMFFDTKAVIRRVDKTTRRVFSKFGAFVRRGAKSSIRKRKAVSEPGSPPSSHVGLLKKLIYFGYDHARRSVVIGPTRLNRKVGNAPEALERGGRSEAFVGGRRSRRKKRMTVKARPYMGPAFEKELPKLPAMWTDSVKR